MKTNNNALFVLGGIVIIGLLMWLLGSQPSKDNLRPEEDVAPDTNSKSASIDIGADITDALFICDDKKAIGANFHKNGVILNLSDGRNITLPQTLSASGARYTSNDESFVFWNKGDTAFIEENGTRTYDNCNVQKGEF